MDRGRARCLLLRRPRAISRHGWPDRRLRGLGRPHPRHRRNLCRGDRSSRPHFDQTARGIRGGYRGRQRSALRRAAGLRRAACRFPRDEGRPQTPPSGAPHRSLQGCGGQPGPPSFPPDARTTHPPRQGHEQYLHRSSAARRHGINVCRLSRPGGTQGDRATRARHRSDPRGHFEPSRTHRAARGLLRHFACHAAHAT